MLLVPETGLEPVRLAAEDFKSASGRHSPDLPDGKASRDNDIRLLLARLASTSCHYRSPTLMSHGLPLRRAKRMPVKLQGRHARAATLRLWPLWRSQRANLNLEVVVEWHIERPRITQATCCCPDALKDGHPAAGRLDRANKETRNFQHRARPCGNEVSYLLMASV